MIKNCMKKVIAVNLHQTVQVRIRSVCHQVYIFLELKGWHAYTVRSPTTGYHCLVGI